MDLNIYEDDNLIIVTPNSYKKRLLKENSNNLMQIKFMSLEEYKRNYCFSYDNKTIDYLISKYNYNLDFVKIIIKNLYAIELDKEYNNSKLKHLQEIKKDLTDNKYLTYNPLFKNYLGDKKIIVYNYPLLEEYEIKLFPNAEIINLESKEITQAVNHCNNLEEEIIFVIENIIKLVKEDIPLDKITVSNVTNDSLYIIYKLFSYYNIPINIDMNQSLYGTNIVKNYLKTKELPGFINPVVKSLISVINSLKDVEDSPNYNEFLIDSLKSTNITSIKYQNAVTITNDIPLVDDDHYLFVIGFNQDVLPKIYKDEDYISDDIKNQVGLTVSSLKNKQEKEKIKTLISNTKNCILSYKDRSNFNEFLKSSLIDELNLQIIDYKPSITNSDLYNKLLLGSNLDDYYKYKEEKKTLRKLYSHYSIPYNTYDNSFTKINKEELYDYLNSFLKVSYTSLNSYYLCKFQYYVKYILKIDPFKPNFSTVIGNLFHYIFSVMDNPLFNFEREWGNYLSKEELTVKERFFLENLKQDLIDDIRLIKDQDILTRFKNKKYEEEVNIDLLKKINVVLTGKIDKVMYQQEGNEDLVSIIDYKTGTITTNINNLKYGLSMQLPIYLYLVRKSNLFTNPKIVGIYLQKVLNSKYSFDKNKTKEDIQKENLKLQGYSISDIDKLEVFDKTYEKSELIKGLKLNKDLSFSNHSKVLTEEDFNNVLKYTDKLINEAVDSILEGDFSINPKSIDNKNLSCQFCKYKDICFMNNKDLVYLEKSEDLSFLDEEDNNGLD